VPPRDSRSSTRSATPSGFFAPYITGWLADLTGTQNAGMWVVGAAMVAAGIVTLILKAAPAPDNLDAKMK
jgi:nitrate/nitrite transporter NarK